MMTDANLPGPRLVELLRRHLDMIMAREADAAGVMHLYRTGDYWTAFEHSAYELKKLCPDAPVTPMLVRGIPDAIVTACIADSRLGTVLHGLECIGDGQREKTYQMPGHNDATGYGDWHKHNVAIIGQTMTFSYCNHKV